MLRMNAQQTALWNSGTGKFDHLSMKDISAEAAARNAKAKAEKDADKAEEKLKQAQKEAKKAAKKAKKASDKADKANQKAAAKAKKAEGAFAGAGGASEAIVAGAEELTRAEALKDEIARLLKAGQVNDNGHVQAPHNTITEVDAITDVEIINLNTGDKTTLQGAADKLPDDPSQDNAVQAAFRRNVPKGKQQ